MDLLFNAEFINFRKKKFWKMPDRTIISAKG